MNITSLNSEKSQVPVGCCWMMQQPSNTENLRTFTHLPYADVKKMTTTSWTIVLLKTIFCKIIKEHCHCVVFMLLVFYRKQSQIRLLWIHSQGFQKSKRIHSHISNISNILIFKYINGNNLKIRLLAHRYP